MIKMTYTLSIDNPAKRAFKRLPIEIRQVLFEKAHLLKDNPTMGEQLRGKYRFLRSLHCSIKGTAYRIIYQVFPASATIFIRLAGSRENIDATPAGRSQRDQLPVKPTTPYLSCLIAPHKHRPASSSRQSNAG